MSYKTKVSAIVGLHWFWMFLGFVSLPLILLYPNLKPVALIFIGITILSWILWRGCAFIIWENALHARNNPKNIYDEAFASHYLKKYFKLTISTPIVRTIIYLWMGITIVICLIHI